MAMNMINIPKVFVMFTLVVCAYAQLTTNFYSKTCPKALPTIREIVEEAIEKEARIGASLLRLHFHDCFVGGCDGSVLLDDTPTLKGEKTAAPNNNSLRGFEVVDQIKTAVDQACGGKSVVSCADILTVAAMDSVNILGGPCWDVPLGRRDSTTAFFDAANTDLPSPSSNLPALIASFKKKGLDLKDLVALSGGHTIGKSRCVVFRDRIWNDTNINSTFAASLRANCPRLGGDDKLAPLDQSTPDTFDNDYFTNLLSMKGLLHSDQELFNKGMADAIVKNYSNPFAFSSDFATSMVKMGNIKPLTGSSGQIRVNCRNVN